MSKVKVSKEVFEAFKKTEGPGWYFEDKEKYLAYMIGYKLDKSFGSRTAALNELSYGKFLKALNDGYELELTPHEIIKKHFDSNAIVSSGVDGNAFFSSGFLQGVLLTLEALGEKVEGVNK